LRALIVIVGPIASGKSTIACELGVRFRAADRPVAVLDLDHVVATVGGFAGITAERFRQAQVVYGDLVGSWLRRGFDVIAHGPFALGPDRAAFSLRRSCPPRREDRAGATTSSTWWRRPPKSRWGTTRVSPTPT
jgi:hypothetical protein